MNPALHDCLDALARTALALENGWQHEVTVHYLEASLAASLAFPLHSPESEALSVLLGAFEAAARRAAA